MAGLKTKLQIALLIVCLLAALVGWGIYLFATETLVMVISLCLWLVLPIVFAPFAFKLVSRCVKHLLCTFRMVKTLSFLYGTEIATRSLSQFGVKQFLNSDFQGAIRTSKLVLELNRESPDGWYNLGVARFYATEYQEAVKDLTTALQIDEHHQAANTIRGYAHGALAEYQAAVKDLERVECTLKGHSHIAYARGRYRELLHLWQSAFEDFQLARRLDESYLEPRICEARLQAGCPDPRFRNGKSALKNAMELCEHTEWKDWLCVSVLGAAYSELNDFENALSYAQMAFELAPEEEKEDRQNRINQFRNQVPYRIPETDSSTGFLIEESG